MLRRIFPRLNSVYGGGHRPSSSLLFDQHSYDGISSEFPSPATDAAMMSSSSSCLDNHASDLPPHVLAELQQQQQQQQQATGSASHQQLPPHLAASQQHQQRHHNPSPAAPVINEAYAGYTGALLPAHATKLLCDAARAQGLTSPYWVTSRVIKNKNIPLKPGAKPVSVCLEGEGSPRCMRLRFVDDLDAEDVRLFMRTLPIPIPENAFLAGQLLARGSSLKKFNNKYRPHQNQQQQYHPPSAPAPFNPVVYCLQGGSAPRWRVPGNADTVQKLCSVVNRRRRNPLQEPEQKRNAEEELLPPVFIADCYTRGSDRQHGDDAGIRVVRDELFNVEESGRTLFFNAEHTLTPPHTFLPLVPPLAKQQQMFAGDSHEVDGIE